MKAIDWQRFFQQQREDHQKTVFTTAELANIAGSDPKSLNIALQRLILRHIITRYATGKYGLPGAVRPEDLVPEIDNSAYITAMFALCRHQMVAQSPTEITCFTNHRHNKSRVRETPLGRIVFVCVSSTIYVAPDDGIIAPPEQALCDFFYLCRRMGIVPGNIVTFRNLDRLDRDRLRSHMARYPGTLQREVTRLLAAR